MTDRRLMKLLAHAKRATEEGLNARRILAQAVLTQPQEDLVAQYMASWESASPAPRSRPDGGVCMTSEQWASLKEGNEIVVDAWAFTPAVGSVFYAIRPDINGMYHLGDGTPETHLRMRCVHASKGLNSRWKLLVDECRP